MDEFSWRSSFDHELVVVSINDGLVSFYGHIGTLPHRGIITRRDRRVMSPEHGTASAMQISIRLALHVVRHRVDRIPETTHHDPRQRARHHKSRNSSPRTSPQPEHHRPDSRQHHQRQCPAPPVGSAARRESLDTPRLTQTRNRRPVAQDTREHPGTRTPQPLRELRRPLLIRHHNTEPNHPTRRDTSTLQVTTPETLHPCEHGPASAPTGPLVMRDVGTCGIQVSSLRMTVIESSDWGPP